MNEEIMIKFEKMIPVFLIVFFLITSSGYIYPQVNQNDIVKDKRKYELREEGHSVEQGFIEYKNRFNSHKNTSEEEIKVYSRETTNYFRIDYSGNSLWNGKHWLPDKFPLKVYVEKSESDKYKEVFKDFVEYAFKVWQKADPRINYSFINSADKADIIILFEENLMDKYDENFLGLTDYELAPNREIKLSTVEISLLKYRNELLSEGEIKATIVHEIGHALGLGHSNNAADLMYPFIDPRSTAEMNYGELSRGDKEAIRSVIDLCYYMKYSVN